MANSTVLNLNFDDAPPASGGGGFGDHLDPGPYVLTVKNMDVTTTKTDKTMVVAEYVNSEMKRLFDRFVLPRANSDDNNFSLQRLHAMMVACGVPNMTGQGNKQLDMKQLEGRSFVGEVVDEVMQAQGEYPERTISKVNGYLVVGSEDANKMLAFAGQQAAPAAPAPAPAPQQPAAAPEAPPAAAEQPAVTVTPPTPEPTPETPAVPASAVGDELDDLFSN